MQARKPEDIAQFQYKRHPIHGILYKFHFGTFSKEDIFRSWEYAIENKLIPLDIPGFLLDYRMGGLDISLNEEQEIIDFFHLHSDTFDNKKLAVIVNTPKDTVMPFLIEHQQKKYHLKVFSTEEAAMNWILV